MKRRPYRVGRNEHVGASIVHVDEAVSLPCHRQSAFDRRAVRRCEVYACSASFAFLPRPRPALIFSRPRFWFFEPSTARKRRPGISRTRFSSASSNRRRTISSFAPRETSSRSQSAPTCIARGAVCLQYLQDLFFIRNIFFHVSLSQGVNPAVVGTEVKGSVRSDLHCRVDILTDVVSPEHRTAGVDAVEEVVL